jgi:hypothetical protein
VFAAAFAPALADRARFWSAAGRFFPRAFRLSPASMPAMTPLLIQGFQFNNGLQVTD